MSKIQQKDISYLLNEVAKSLDIADSLFEEAERKYKAVGKWLGEEPSPLAAYSPQINPQGSFILGTVTRPADDSDDYDIDVVFELALKKGEITQKELKKMVGDRLKDNETYRKMLAEEKRRCWRLQYADDVHFHLDILPAIPDDELRTSLKGLGVPQYLAGTSLAITDNQLPNFNQITSEWPRSNPKGYAAWFREQMIVQYQELQKRFAENAKADISKVPEYHIKTPLQRCIQLFKRHRDLVFIDDPDNQPISIIITTLAALAYNNESDITDALSRIIDGIPQYITVRNGTAWVANPVDPTENFADRWKDNPALEPNFYKWLKTVKVDLNRLLDCDDIDRLSELLTALFGERVAISAMKRYKESTQGQETGGSVERPIRPAVVPIIHPLEPWGE